MILGQFVGGRYRGALLEQHQFKPGFEVLHPKSRKTLASFIYSDIASIELLEDKDSDLSDPVVVGLVSGMLAGPIGLAAGAALAHETSKRVVFCTFIIQMNNGQEHVCIMKRPIYREFRKAHRIALINDVSPQEESLIPPPSGTLPFLRRLTIACVGEPTAINWNKESEGD